MKNQELKIHSLESEISQLKDQINHLQVENKDAKQAAKELCQQLDTLKRYLFVKICHMFS